MRTFFIFSFLLLAAGAFAQTPVSGEQSGTWAISDSPFLVTGDVTVPAGQTLTIEPGVEVNFQGHFKLIVNGSLQAAGTETDTIFFTTDDPSTGWHGIRLEASQSGSIFKYCRIEYGKTSGSNYPDQHGGGVMMYNSDAYFENCLFFNNEATADDNGMGGAIYAFNSTSETQIINCVFLNNHTYGEGGAIKFTGDTGADVIGCSFVNNSVLYGGGAVCLYGCYDTHFYKCLFSGNVTSYSSGGAVFIEGYSARIRFVNCTMYGNHATGGDGGAVEIAFSDASFTNSIVYNNPGAYSDNIYLDFGYAEINYCNTPFPDGAEGENNMNTNPQFEDATGGDFHLTPDSPCIDAGIDSLTITTAFNEVITVIDLDSTEYIGLAPDMGCYEYDPSTGFSEQFESDINVFPNPVTSILNYDLKGQKVITITISDINGKIVFENHKPAGNKVDLTLFKNGIYFVVFQTVEAEYTAKILKK